MKCLSEQELVLVCKIFSDVKNKFKMKEIIRDEDEIVDNILELFRSDCCYGTDETYGLFESLKDYIFGISMFIKDTEYIKSILEKVCLRIPSVRNDSLPGLTSTGYQEELKYIILNIEDYICG